MPRNPMLSRGRDAQNTGVNSPDRSAEPQKNYIQRNNDFDLSYSHLATLRFADVHPFFVMDGLPADRLPFRSYHELRSYTLQSPMMSDIKLHKSFTMVPMQAILPNTWDRFIVNPTKGDDVPDDVYCNYPILAKLRAFVSLMFGNHSALTDAQLSVNFVKCAIALECVFSSGSLLACLGIDFSKLWPDFDVYFDTSIVPMLKTLPVKLGVDFGNISGTFAMNSDVASSVSATYVENMHDALDFLRDGCDILASGDNPSSFVREDLDDLCVSILSKLSQLNALNSAVFNYAYDISKPIAYQLSCIQIMTDDSIDDIYTPNLFRQLIYEYTEPAFFTYNGAPIMYDEFSMNRMISISSIYEFFTLIFSFRKSLKFGDYFIDARPQPYSVGDMSAQVVNGEVSSIDTTRSILAQRFLNWSNRVGNKIHDYILALTGVSPTATTDEPKYIIHEVFDVSGFEVENTADGQRDDVSVTTQLKTQNDRYIFDIEINEYCIILGLAHFDVKRIYTGRVDRSNLKSNRFDFFNKFFQYAGDQDIKRIELSAAISNADDPMAYTTRHMQYKTAVSHAVGGFSNGTLPSWAFVNDESSELTHGIKPFGINSDFIRNHNSEFDRFYSSLTGYSLGTYFHFIVKFNNIANMNRQMAIAPDIL